MTQKMIIEDNIKEKEIYYENDNVITGNNNYLYNKLKEAMKKSIQIDIIVSFLMESGVKLILNDLKKARDKGVKVRILTGNYLRITQPQALYLLKGTLGDKIDIKFFDNDKISFHPKAYIFHYENNLGELFAGSSNISRGALTNSIEWNYRLVKKDNEIDFNEFFKTFENLFLNHSYEVTDDVMREYSKTWIRPKIYKDLDKIKSDENLVEDNENTLTGDNIKNIYEATGAQLKPFLPLIKQERKEMIKL